jgi:hypothetical protein
LCFFLHLAGITKLSHLYSIHAVAIVSCFVEFVEFVAQNREIGATSSASNCQLRLHLHLELRKHEPFKHCHSDSEANPMALKFAAILGQIGKEIRVLFLFLKKSR